MSVEIKSFIFYQVSPNITEYLIFDFLRVAKYCNFIGQNAILLQIEQSNSLDATFLDRYDDYLHNRVLISISDPFKEMYNLFSTEFLVTKTLVNVLIFI